MAKSAKKDGTSRSGPVSPSRAFDESVRDLVQVSRLLGDETRLRILFYLVQNQELHVTDLCERLGQSQPAVSHHLALLRVSGLIESRREGKHNFYSVRSEAFGDLLLTLFTAVGEPPKKLKLQDFTLNYQDRTAR